MMLEPFLSYHRIIGTAGQNPQCPVEASPGLARGGLGSISIHGARGAAQTISIARRGESGRAAPSFYALRGNPAVNP